MSQKGLLIDYEFCTGCHTCEMACKVEKGFPVGQWGIKLAEIGPWQKLDGTWEWNYVPLPTEQCDLCEDRVAAGKPPACVHHCQALVMEYGEIEDLAKMINKSHMVLFAPQA